MIRLRNWFLRWLYEFSANLYAKYVLSPELADILGVDKITVDLMGTDALAATLAAQELDELDQFLDSQEHIH